MVDLVHYSNLVLAGLGLLLAATIPAGTLWTNDEAARVTSISFLNSIAYLPYFFAIGIASRVPDTPRPRHVVLAAAICFRFLAFPQPPLLSDDVLRYQWEAEVLSSGLNPYLVSPAQLSAPDHRIPGYDFSAVYGPVLQAMHWVTYQLGLPPKASAAAAEALLVFAAWRYALPLPQLLLLAWCPLSLFEFWINGHNDAWLILLLFLALQSAGPVSWFWLVAATLTKWWPALLIPLWLRAHPGFAGPALFGLGLGSCIFLMPIEQWILKIRFTTGFLGGWQNNAFLYHLLSDKSQALALNVVTGIALAFSPLSGPLRLLCFLTIFLAFSANIQPWYLSWFLPVLASTPVRPLPWLLPMALLPLAYDPMYGWRLNQTWVEDPLIRLYIWSAVSAFALFQVLRSRNG